MVPKSSHKRKTVSSFETRLISYSLVAIFTLTFIGIVLLGMQSTNCPTIESIEPVDIVSVPPEEEPELEPVITEVDFQPVIDDWVQNIGGNKSVLIFDLKRDVVVGSYNADENYGTASLYKLFVVYKGYEYINEGVWDINSPARTTGYTIGECLDLAIRESHSACAETIRSMIGLQALEEAVVNDYHIVNSDVNKLISNPRDIMSIMKLFYKHETITDETLINKIKDSFLNQPTTTYNWRQGLPSGFSKAKVYNKVGWEYDPDGKYWNIYHDAAIVDFPDDDRLFIVVVMTNKVPFQKIRDLGSMIEKSFYEQIVE